VKLYLVRHAEAIERSGTTPDASRCLTTKGRLAFRKIARRVRKGAVLAQEADGSTRKGTAEFLWRMEEKGTVSRLADAT